MVTARVGGDPGPTRTRMAALILFIVINIAAWCAVGLAAVLSRSSRRR